MLNEMNPDSMLFHWDINRLYLYLLIVVIGWIQGFVVIDVLQDTRF